MDLHNYIDVLIKWHFWLCSIRQVGYDENQEVSIECFGS